MRCKVFVVVALVVGVGLAGYTAVSAGTNYIATRELVGRVVDEAAARGRMPANGTAPTPIAAVVRAEIARGVAVYGLPIDARQLLVTELGGRLTVRVHWSQPLLTSAWAVPMSFEQTFNVR